MKRFFAVLIAIVLLLGIISAYAYDDKEPTLPLFPGSTDAKNGGDWITQIQARLWQYGYYEDDVYHSGEVDQATSAALQRYYIRMGKVFNYGEPIGVEIQKQILNGSIIEWVPEEEQQPVVTLAPTAFPVFTKGSSAPEIREIQTLLSSAGYFDMVGMNCMPGVLDDGTMKALEAYMNMWGFAFYGTVDENVYKVITAAGTSMPTPKVTPTPTPSPAPTVFIEYNTMEDDHINEVQLRLEQLGYLKSGKYAIGQYDETLQKALYLFCDANSITPDDGGINNTMYNAIMSDGAIAKPVLPIHPGESSDEIELLQKNLYELNCYVGLVRSGNVCDDAMIQAVARFAEANSIDFNGTEITPAIQNAILGEKATAWVEPEPEKVNWFLQSANVFGLSVPRYAVVIVALLVVAGLAVLLISTFSKDKPGEASISGKVSSGSDEGANVELQVIYHGTTLGKYRKKITTPIHIGRGFNVIPLDQSDLSISKNHCQLSFHDGTLFLRDFSRNGTRVNGISVHNGESVVRNNAEIEVGDHRIIVTLL